MSSILLALGYTLRKYWTVGDEGKKLPHPCVYNKEQQPLCLFIFAILRLAEEGSGSHAQHLHQILWEVV